MELHELQLKEFIAKKHTGELLIHSIQTPLNSSLQPVGLTFSEDGKLRFGDHVMLHNVKSNGVLSMDMLEPLSTIPNAYGVTCSSVVKGPVARNVFVIESVSSDVKEGDTLTYGQRFRLRVNPLLLREPHYLQSQLQTPLICSTISRHQQVAAVAWSKFDTEFLLEHKSISKRFESEGKPVQANEPLVLIHAQTRQALASDKIALINDYGQEYEVCAHTFKTIEKTRGLCAEAKGIVTGDIAVRGEQEQNHWSFLTASDEELQLLLNQQKNELEPEPQTVESSQLGKPDVNIN